VGVPVYSLETYPCLTKKGDCYLNELNPIYWPILKPLATSFAIPLGLSGYLGLESAILPTLASHLWEGVTKYLWHR
jgi:hypothetical protein